jgi:Ecdysteroid kinase-like family
MVTVLRDFNAGLSEAELRLVIRNLAYFHAASAALARIKRIDLAQHYGPLSQPFDIAGKNRKTDQDLALKNVVKF